jgi:hypothetical protein
MDSFDSRMEYVTKRVRVDMPDFHRKSYPYDFQDCMTSLEDYFDLFGLSMESEVRFIKMEVEKLR